MNLLARWSRPIKAWRSRRVPPAPPARASRFREVAAERLSEFLAKGFHQRHVFPHRLYYLPCAGFDGMKLARSMYGHVRAADLRQIVLFATGPALDGIAPELFFDDDLVWHRQQLGMPGHVATANLVIRDRTLLTTARYSDVVQRISRRPSALTRVEKRFHGWDHMLLNGILAFAVERNLDTIRLPTSHAMMANTDPARTVGAPLFERIYDHDVRQRFDAEREGGAWVVDVRRNRHRLVMPAAHAAPLGQERTICLSHDVEGALGHHTPADLARVTRARSAENLARMLEVEARRGVRGTYNVVGCLMNDLRSAIDAARCHEVAFHSYDHTRHENQLGLCRNLDARVVGYRPPQSTLTPELTDGYLAYHNFQWLASSPRSIGTANPGMRSGIVYVPVRFDDYPMYRAGDTFTAWEGRALAMIRAHDVTAIGLHDCYGDLWLDHYDELLRKLADLGRLETVGEVATRTILGSAE